MGLLQKSASSMKLIGFREEIVESSDEIDLLKDLIESFTDENISGFVYGHARNYGAYM